MVAVPKDLRTAYTVDEREAFIEHLVHIVYTYLKDQLYASHSYLGYRWRSCSHKEIVEHLCRTTCTLESILTKWRDNTDKKCGGGMD